MYHNEQNKTFLKFFCACNNFQSNHTIEMGLRTPKTCHLLLLLQEFLVLMHYLHKTYEVNAYR